MGIDVVMFSLVDSEPTDEQMQELLDRVMDVLRLDEIGEEFKYEAEGSWWCDDPHVYWDTWMRFYGPGYERGDWPVIACVAAAMRAVFGNVFYGGDHQGAIPSLNGDKWLEMWRYWMSSDWRNYWSNR